MATDQKTVSTRVPEKRGAGQGPEGKSAYLAKILKENSSANSIFLSTSHKDIDTLIAFRDHLVHFGPGGPVQVPALDAIEEDFSAQVKSLVTLGRSLAGQLAETGMPARAIELLRELTFVDVEAASRLALFHALQAAKQQVAEGTLPLSGGADPFELLTASKMAKALGVSDETVRNYEKANELFSFMSPARKRGRGYPAFQALKNVSGVPLSKVLAVLKGLDGASTYQFFSSPSAELADLTPVEVMTARLTVPRMLNNDGLEILQASDARRLAVTVGAAKVFHADAAA